MADKGTATIDPASDAAAEQGAKKLSLSSGRITAEFGAHVDTWLAANTTYDKAGLVRTAVATMVGYDGKTAPESKRGGVSTNRRLKSLRTNASKVIEQMRAIYGDAFANDLAAQMRERGALVDASESPNGVAAES